MDRGALWATVPGVAKSQKECGESYASQMALVVKYPPANAKDKRLRFDPWLWKIPWRRAWQSIPVFLPGDSHGQMRLVGYGP